MRDLGMTLLWMMVKEQTKDTAFIKDVKNSLELFRVSLFKLYFIRA